MIWQTLVMGAATGAGILGFLQWRIAHDSRVTGSPAWPTALLASMLSMLVDASNAPLPVALWPREALSGFAAALFLIGAAELGRAPLAWRWWAGAAGLAVIAATAGEAARQVFTLVDQRLPIIEAPLLGCTAWLLRPLSAGDHGRLRQIAAAACLLLAAGGLLAMLPGADTWSTAAGGLAVAALAVALIPLTTAAERRSRETRTAATDRVGRQVLAAVETLPQGIALFDDRDRLLLCNAVYRQMLAPIADRLVPGTSFDDIVGLAEPHGLGATALGRPPEETRPDGRGPIEARNLRTADGGMVAIRADIGELSRTAAAMRDGRDRLRGILDAVGEGIVTIDRHGIVDSFNGAACRIFGYQPDEVIGRNVSMLMPQPHGDLASHPQTGEALAIGPQGVRKDGSGFPLDLAVTELRRDEGNLYIGVLRDLTERRSMEQALLESEQRFRDLAEVASDWFWETGPDLRFTFISSSVRQALGVKTAFFIGKSLLDLAARGTEPDKIHAHYQRMDETEPFRDFVCRQELPDGPVKFLKMNGRPMFEVGGGFRGYRGTATDITAEVEARASADRAQVALMAALESMSEGFVLWGADDRLVLCNEKFRQFFTAPDRIAPGVHFTDATRAMAASGHIHDARGHVEEWLEQRVRAHRQSAGGLEIELANGQWVLASEHVTQEGFVVGIYTDITPLKRREQEIARQTALSQAIIDHMPQGISVFDGEMRLVALNRTAQTLFSVPEQFMLPGRSTYRDFMRLLAESGEFGTGDTGPLAEERAESTRADVPLLSERGRPDGATIEVRRNSMPDGGFIATYTDITESKRTERTLRDAKEAAERGNRAKAAFLANTSHELRTPLNAIIGFSEVMVGELFGPLGQPKYQDYARDIYESGSHLLNLINDILDMSKADAGKIEVEDSVFEIRTVVAQTLRLVRERAKNAKVVLECNLPAELPLLRADQRRFRQILLNLLSNALKFTDEGGMVTVAAGLQRGGLVVEVADTGVGMLPDDLSKAMEPFGQIDSRLSRKYEGTGLGLPLTKALIEAHGGTLELESVYGRGTRAMVLFPLNRTVRRRPRRSIHGPPPTGFVPRDEASA